MQLEPVAVFHSPIPGKFGVPRQAGLAGGLKGTIELTGEYRQPDALRGLDGFDYLWLIWNFNLNESSRNKEGRAGQKTTVRPPRLGGNERVGVFASRSPFRPNGLGLSSVRIESIDFKKCVIHVAGADLADGTPIFDIKPYIEYADSHTGIRSGFVDCKEWQALEVLIDDKLDPSGFYTEAELAALKEILALDPRPAYHEDPSKIYGLDFAGYNVRFSVRGTVLTVREIDASEQALIQDRPMKHPSVPIIPDNDK